MPEPGPIIVETSKTVASAGTPEVLTTRDVYCNSVLIVPLSTNTQNSYVVDSVTTSKKIKIPTSGITIPVNNPAAIKIDVDVNGEGVSWMAV